jgi:hypothetical protein
MTTTTNPYPDIPLPSGRRAVLRWWYGTGSP